MRQAVAAVLRWAYTHAQLNRVHAYVRVDNTRSARLIERNGFVREGCLRSYRVCRGQPHDFYVYGLLRSEWAAQAGVAPEGDAPTQALAGPEDERPPPRSKAVETK